MRKQALLTAVCLLVALTGCARKPLTPVTPWADLADDSLSFFTTSTDPGGLQVCYVFDWGDGSSTTTDYFASGDTGYCAHRFDDTRVHYIRVRARNEKGASSGWSPSLCLRLSHAPQLADTITGRLRWAADRWYRASVRFTDPDGDSVAVKFVWGDLPTAGWSAYVPSGSVVTDSCKWSVTGPHTVGVVLRDKGGTMASSSAVKTVNVSRMAIIWDTYSDELYCDGTPTLGSIDGEPVLYCGGGEVYCITLDGRVRWRTPMDASSYAPSLSADGTRLYFNDYSHGLACLDARSGQLVWSIDSCGVDCTPSLGPDGAIYVVSCPMCINELQRVRDYGDSAAVEWTLPLGDWGPVDNGVVVGRDGTVYAVGYDLLAECSFLVAVDSGGTVLWQDSARIKVGGTPVIDSRGRIIVTDQSGGLFCFNPDGSVAWSTATNPLWTDPTAIGWNDEIIVIDGDDQLRCFDSEGHERWSSSTTLNSYSNTPCVTRDSTIIAVDPSGYVCCLGSAGQTLWEFSTWDSLGYYKRRAKRLDGNGYSSPAIGPNGDLYVATGEALVCIAHGGLKMANTAWPTYNHDAAHSGWAGRQQR